MKARLTMPDLIDREVVIRTLLDNVREMESDVYYESKMGVPEDDIEELINEIPPADTERHAHWENVTFDNEKGVETTFECSNCKTTITFGEPVDTPQDYIDDYYFCSKCGCKMGEVKNEQSM